jgi:hypothetical protein
MAAPFPQPVKHRVFVQQNLPAQSDNAAIKPVRFPIEKKVADSPDICPFVLLAELRNGQKGRWPRGGIRLIFHRLNSSRFPAAPYVPLRYVKNCGRGLGH